MSRILAISDIHGHTDGVRLLLEAARYEPGVDELFLLGDYIDYDPSTWSALDDIRQLTAGGARAIAGNMETWLCSTPNERSSVQDAGPALASWLDFAGALPYYQLHTSFLFVHAGLRPGLKLEDQLPADLTGIREPFLLTRNPYPLPVIFGHTPTRRMGAAPGEIWVGPGIIGIDTGAKHGLRLSLVNLTNQTVYSCSTDPDNLYGDMRFTAWVSHPYALRK
ncbi:metallophosphoesterase family protein [Paenibacillus sp. NPDC056579]|uniref:metallophosphoesterase family protein n=1 Tax=Paenibacillus sp. NPDC056579 TaxID=3345871 RepID=UPI0036AAE7BD